MEEIQKVVADYFDIRMADMTSNRRPQNIAFPAPGGHVPVPGDDPPLAALHRHRLRRNHATVLHACRLVQDRLKGDPAFRQTVVVLQQRLSKRLIACFFFPWPRLPIPAPTIALPTRPVNSLRA
jgi:chromosomal replication initiator protein